MHNNQNNQYFIFEYLKCENEYLTPHKSNPKYYPYNWRKFHSLFQLAKKIKGKLILVNYSDGYRQVIENNTTVLKELPNKKQCINEVKVFIVSNIKYDMLQQYEATPYNIRPKHLDYLEYELDKNFTLEEFSQ